MDTFGRLLGIGLNFVPNYWFRKSRWDGNGQPFSCVRHEPGPLRDPVVDLLGILKIVQGFPPVPGWTPNKHVDSLIEVREARLISLNYNTELFGKPLRICLYLEAALSSALVHGVRVING